MNTQDVSICETAVSALCLFNEANYLSICALVLEIRAESNEMIESLTSTTAYFFIKEKRLFSTSIETLFV